MIENLFKKYDLLIKKVYEKLKSSNNPKYEGRYYHSLGVAKAAVELCKVNNLSDELTEKAFICGVIHDYCKYEKMDKYQQIIDKYKLNMTIKEEFKSIYHSILAPYIIKEELEINDLDILSAIECHAMGKPNMNELEKIIFLSDFIEETRVGECYRKARKVAFANLDKGVFFVSKSVLSYLISINAYIYPMSIETYNYYKKYSR